MGTFASHLGRFGATLQGRRAALVWCAMVVTGLLGGALMASAPAGHAAADCATLGGDLKAAGQRVADTPITDVDGDGEAIVLDRCPSLPEDFDGHQDGDGCPELDNDMDRIEDLDDDCPNTPEDRNGINDGDGCPEFATTLGRRRASRGAEARRGSGRLWGSRKRISLELVGADVRDVLRLIAIESNVNIVYDPNVKGTISASLRNAPLEDVFIAVLKSAGLWYETTGAVLLVQHPR